MRKFRLKANATRWFDSFMKGVVYNEDSRGDYNNGKTVLEYVQEFPNDWVEVFDPIFNHQKPFTTDSIKLHKDTDLGYYAGLAMQGMLSNSSDTLIRMDNDVIIKHSIGLAKELIKQLNEETK